MRGLTSKTFRTIFLSYAFIILLTCAILVSMLYVTNVNDLSENSLGLYNSALAQASKQFEARMTEFRNAALRISVDSSIFLSSNGQYRYYNKIECVEVLQRYKASNVFFSEIILHSFADDQLVYSARGSSNLDVLLRGIYDFSSDSIAAFSRRMRSEEQVSIEYFKDEDMLAYYLSLPTGAKNKTGVAVFMVDGLSIRQLYDNVLAMGEGYVLLLDAGGMPVIRMHSTNTQRDEDEALEQALLDAWYGGMGKVVVGGVEYLLFDRQTDRMDWHIVSAIRSDDLLFAVYARKVNLMISVLLLLMLLLFVAFVVAMRSYRPVHKLLSFAMDDEQDKMLKVRDDYEYIQTALRQNSKVNRELSEHLRQHRQMLLQSAMLRLLDGDIKEREAPLRIVEELGIVPLRRSIFVIAIRLDWENDANAPNATPILYAIDSAFEDKPVYSVELDDQGEIALVLELTEEWSQQEWVAQIQSIIQPESMPRLRMGVGRLYNNLFDAHLSFIEARAALDNSMHRKQTVYFEVLLQEQTDLPGIRESKILYLQALKQGNGVQAKATLDLLLDAMQKELTGSENLMYHGTVLGNEVMEIATANTPDFLTDIKDGQVMCAVQQIYAPRRFSDYRANMMLLTELICQRAAAEREQADSRTREAILKYVQAHYLNSNISLNDLSDKFGFSVSYWSRFFRDKINMNFSEYIWTVRLEEAKRMFVETDKTLKEIVNEIGYLDISSFIRRFKRDIGMTPGQYRQMTREERNTSTRP